MSETGTRMRSWLLAFACFLFAGPVLAWVLGTSGSVASDPALAGSIRWGSWAQLVAWTGALAAGGALLATLLGATLALVLELTRVRGRRALDLLLLIPFVTPAAVLTTAWHALLGGTFLSFLTTGPTAVVVLSGFQLAPVVTWVVVRHLKTMGAAEHAAVLVSVAPNRRLRDIYWPAVRGVAMRAFALVFLLLLPSREVAGYAGVDTAGDRILAAFSAGGGDVEGWLLVATLALVTLPLLRLAVIPLLTSAGAPRSRPRTGVLAGVTSAASSPGATSRRWPTVLLWLWVTSWLVPLGALAVLAGSASVSTADIWGVGLLLESLRCLTLAVIMTAFGWVLSTVRSPGAWLLVLLPLFLPGTLSGLALSTGVQHWLPAWLTELPLLMNVAQFVRFVGVAALLGRVSRDTIPAAELAALQLLPSWRARAVTVIRRAWLPLASTVCVCFALCIGEVESTALLVPPGYVSPVVELHQFLHFRHDAHAAQLATGMVLVVLLLAGCAAALQRARQGVTR